MSDIRHRHRILEAIDQLRRRKARPDVNRICSYMFRRFSVSCGETKSDLQKLIDAEIVIKVDYKGNTSYRNAAKWAMLPNYKSKQELDSSNTSSILSSAVAELIVLEPDYLDIGVPALELEKHLLKKDSKRFTKKNLENILKREIDNGTLVKLENGNYFLGEHSNTSKQNNSNCNFNSSQKSANRPSLSSRPKTKKLKTNKQLDAPPSSCVLRAGDNCISVERKEEQKEKMDENGCTPSSSSMTVNNNNNNNSENVGYRVGGRQKRAKVMFDPSDNNLPKVSRKRPPGRPPLSTGGVKHHINRSSTSNNLSTNTNRSTGPVAISGAATISPVKAYSSIMPPASSAPLLTVNLPVNPGVCCLCRSYGIRVKGVPERLIVCADCTTSKAHPSCIETKREGACRNKNGLWQCTNCKRCTICDESGKSGKIVVCCSCNDAYHFICHTPNVPLNLVDTDKWKCLKCSSSAVSLSAAPAPSSILATSATVINNSVIRSKSTDSNPESTVIKDNEDVKSPVVNNLPSEAALGAIPSGIIMSSSIKHNNNNNNNSSSLSSTVVSPSSIASNSAAVSGSSSQSAGSVVPTVTSSICTNNKAAVTTDSTITISITNTGTTITTTATTTTITTTATTTTTTTTPSTPTTTSTTITSSATVISRCVSPEIDEAEDVKDVKDVKPVIMNDIKENVQKNFILPLSNGIINNNNNRLLGSIKQHAPSSCLQDPYEGYPVDETIPDAAKWTPQDVFQYFVKYFDHEIANVFKEQEIDGQSLLLMKRLDVLTGLQLKLGPALKIYGHVKKLQIRRSDPKLIWS